MGNCQNYGPFLGPYYNTGPNTGPNLGDPKRDQNFDNSPYIAIVYFYPTVTEGGSTQPLAFRCWAHGYYFGLPGFGPEKGGYKVIDIFFLVSL